MKFVAPSLLSLLLSLSACGERAGAPPPPPEAKTADAKPIADAKAPEVEPVDVKPIADVRPLDVTAADATPPEADADPAVAIAGSAPPAAGTAGAGLYWAEVARDAPRTLIDVNDASGEALTKLVAESETAERIENTLPSNAELPPGFAVGDPWAVATTTGAKHGKAVAFNAYGGSMEHHFIVMIDTIADGLAARSGTWPGPVPTLSAARRVDTSNSPGLELVERITAPIVATAKPSARRALGRKPMASKHLAVIEGRFPRGFTYLVALVRPLVREQDFGNDATRHVGGLLLADATGKVEAIIPPELTIDITEVLYLVDLEGDGIDEVVYDSTYYEGGYRMLMTWDAAGKPVLHTLGGDGA